MSSGDEPSFFDYGVEDPSVVMNRGLVSPQFGPSDLDYFGGPNNATETANRTIVVSPGAVPTRTAPAFSYPTAVGSARTSRSARAAARGVSRVPLGGLALPPANHPSSDTNSPTFYGVNPGSPYFQPGILESPVLNPGSAIYTSDTSSNVSSNSNVAASFQRTPVTVANDPYLGDYVATTTLQNVQQQSPFEFAYPTWPTDVNLDTSMTDPIGIGQNPEYAGSEGNYDGGGGIGIGGGVDDPAFGIPSPEQLPEERDSRGSQGKRSKKSPSRTRDHRVSRGSVSSVSSTSGHQQQQQQQQQRSSSSTSTTPKNKQLRSASRTSKNIQQRPTETVEERKTRNSHNLVEKQYRNRLNAQFESLLAALPDNVRSANNSGFAGGDDSDPGNAGLDLGDKRVSKAEVLDMARRHIKALESERDSLEQERDELMTTMTKLREEVSRGMRGGSSGGGGAQYGLSERAMR